MKRILMIAAIALIAVACSKDQKVVKRLDGTWKANKFVVSNSDGSIDLIGSGFVTSATFTFSNCKLKDDEWCDANSEIIYALGGSQKDTYLFRVTEKGTVLETKDDNSSTTINKIDIVEMTRNTLKLKQVDGDDTIEMSLDKL